MGQISNLYGLELEDDVVDVMHQSLNNYLKSIMGGALSRSKLDLEGLFFSIGLSGVNVDVDLMEQLKV